MLCSFAALRIDLLGLPSALIPDATRLARALRSAGESLGQPTGVSSGSGEASVTFCTGLFLLRVRAMSAMDVLERRNGPFVLPSRWWRTLETPQPLKPEYMLPFFVFLACFFASIVQRGSPS